jgi:hypothetical protein
MDGWWLTACAKAEPAGAMLFSGAAQARYSDRSALTGFTPAALREGR